jgi:tetratricopeptide (TPR) repeat protein
MHRRPVRFVLGLLLAGAISVTAVSILAAPVDSADVDSLFARADRLLRRGAPDSTLALVEPIVERARADGDAEVELKGRLHQAGALALSGRVREAEQTAQLARDLAVQLGEPPLARMASRWLGYALLGQGRSAEARATYEQLLDDATIAGDLREEAYARTGLAYLALGRGETAAAREGYERAAPLFHAVGEKGMEFDALVGLARTLGRDGRYDEMRRLYERIVQEGEQAGLQRVVGFALNNLGTYEYQTGDPSLAVAYWQRVLDQRLSGGDPIAAITPAMNLALAHMELGAFDEASAMLHDLRDRCRDGGYRLQEAQVLEQLASIEQASGNSAGALATWRQIMGMLDAGQEMRIDAALQIANSLVHGGRPRQVLAFRDSLATTLLEDATPQQRAELDLDVAGALAALGRHAEAIPVATRAHATMRALGFRHPEMTALVELAESERALARSNRSLADSALVHLRQAQRLWEDLRSVPRDPQWREQRGSLGSAIHLDLAALLLEEPAEWPEFARASAAFDALQGYKARTLLERMLGPDEFAREPATVEPPVTLARLEREVLRPGEVLLDIYVGERRSLMFAVTDSSCRAVSLPSGRAPQDLVRLFLDLVALPPVQGEDPGVAAYLPAARRLSQEFLAPVASEVRSAKLVTIAADGILNRLPFELLPWDPAGDDPTTLGARCEVARVPSATVLARLRGHGSESSAHGVLVLEGTEPAASDAMPGISVEVRALRRGYRGVEVLSPGCSASDGAWTAAVAGRAVLHIPAHAEAFDQRPWNSRIALGRADDGVSCWLLSADIARLPLDVDLAVLSGCSSAGGRVLSGEGVLGLTGAFLAAGSHAVVASLWDVDDAATAALMRRFYRELAAGRTVAGALAAARQDLACAPATVAPCYWAGFVVVGDGGLRVPLQRRIPLAAVVVGCGVVAALLLGILAWRRPAGFRGPVIFRRGRSLL